LFEEVAMSSFVLVTGATGRQGGAAARALVDAGTAVRALVRDPGAPAALALAEHGATLVTGDLDDPASLAAALAGADGVFSVQTPDLADLMGDQELRHAGNLAAAARAAGVEHVVHTSVSGAGGGRGPVDEQRYGAHLGHYWRSKAAAEQALRAAETPLWTILRPATFMENFLRPSFYFADGTSDRLQVSVDLDVPVAFVAVRDIGAAAAAAFTDPDRFAGVEVELAGDRLSFRAAAGIVGAAVGRPVLLPDDADRADQADQAGPAAEFAASQRYMTDHPAPARPQQARALGLPTTSFADWARTTL
jgi:uncharacterized protein YbjT (DUF2867 family)